MADSEIVALSICQEALGIYSENFFHSKLKNDYHANFPNLPHITRYNCRITIDENTSSFGFRN